MKETLRAPKAQKPVREKFVPCERETNGGAQKPGNGTTCSGGLLFYWATEHDREGRDTYGKPIRWAKRCDCLNRWAMTSVLPPAERQRADLR
jgi:hypothetical protein